MTKSPSRKRRSKLTAILAAPILALIFIVGWSLYWIGQSRHHNPKQQQKPTSKASSKQDEVELIMIPQEEEQMLAN